MKRYQTCCACEGGCLERGSWYLYHRDGIGDRAWTAPYGKCGCGGRAVHPVRGIAEVPRIVAFVVDPKGGLTPVAVVRFAMSL